MANIFDTERVLEESNTRKLIRAQGNIFLKWQKANDGIAFLELRVIRLYNFGNMGIREGLSDVKARNV
jgi:hypothetical protein